MRNFVSSDFQYRPYWWEAAAPTPFRSPTLERDYDVAVVGSGFTGASAALALARGGRSVAIFDQQDPGAGASRRNAGFIGRVLKKTFSEIEASKGLALARATYRELQANYDFTLQLIADETIDCHAGRVGRFVGATSPGHLARLELDLTRLRAELGFAFRMVPRSQVHTEMATESYCGGVVIPDSGSLHPGLYHKGLVERAVAAGSHLFGQTEVLGVTENADGRLTVRTSQGTVRARDLVIATNGHTPKWLPWHRRRLVPFRAFMAATEEIPADLLKQMIPNRRTIIDSNTNIDFFRVAPDSSRILFGGATTENLIGPERIAERLKAILDRVFPRLGDVRLSHVWDGHCAGTFDFVPHLGSRGAVHHGIGYNFAGITAGTRFGHAIASRILGLPSQASVFDTGSFPTIPFYRGDPWFLGLAMRYFAWQDRRTAGGRRPG